jgi:hypothetical protein
LRVRLLTCIHAIYLADYALTKSLVKNEKRSDRPA